MSSENYSNECDPGRKFFLLQTLEIERVIWEECLKKETKLYVDFIVNHVKTRIFFSHTKHFGT